MTTTGSTRPAARRGFVLAAVLAAVGVVGAGTWAGAALVTEMHRATDFSRVTTPGVTAVTLEVGDVRVVYAEGEGELPGPTEIEVTGPDGSAVPLRAPRGEVSYDVPGTTDDRGARGTVGTAVGSFTSTAAGEYLVGTSSWTGTIAVGQDIVPGTLRAIVLPALLALVSLLAGAGLAIRTAIRTTTPTATRTATPSN